MYAFVQAAGSITVGGRRLTEQRNYTATGIGQATLTSYLACID